MTKRLGITDEQFEQLYHRHVDTVYRVCFMLLKNRADAEDAVQTVFIKLLQNEKPFTDHEHEKAWLIRTARNHCLNLLSHWWRRKRVSMDSLSEPEVPHGDNLRELWNLVLNLPARYKTVVYMFYYEGYSTREIAHILEMKESTVRSQLYKARKLLKIEMEGHLYAVKGPESSH